VWIAVAVAAFVPTVAFIVVRWRLSRYEYPPELAALTPDERAAVYKELLIEDRRGAPNAQVEAAREYIRKTGALSLTAHALLAVLLTAPAALAIAAGLLGAGVPLLLGGLYGSVRFAWAWRMQRRVLRAA
jgi:hypothetical protein